MTPNSTDESVQVASASGTLAKKVAGAADPAKSLPGRLGDTAAAALLATRLLPAGWRLLKRYPLPSLLVILGVAWAYSLRPMNTTPTHK